MKVLLDENLDHALRKLLTGHEVFTVVHLGWSGFKNGELLRAAESAGIPVLLTGDQSLSKEQNFQGRQLAVVALSAIELPIIKRHLREIVDAINRASPGSFQIVDCGVFNRRTDDANKA